MAHFFSLNIITASKGSNNYILFVKEQLPQDTRPYPYIKSQFFKTIEICVCLLVVFFCLVIPATSLIADIF